MKARQGYVQGYNAQAVVTEDQYIVAPGLTTEANDQRQLHPMLDEAAANLEAAGVAKKIGAALADAGYCSDKNLTGQRADGPELLVNTTLVLRSASQSSKGLEAAQGASRGVASARTHPEGIDGHGADGAQAVDETRRGALQETGATGRPADAGSAKSRTRAGWTGSVGAGS